MELNDETGKLTPRTVLGRRLTRLRNEAGLSLRQLADPLGYPHSYLGRVERGEQLPSEGLAQALDIFFRTSGLFVELLEMAQDSSIPDYGKAIVSNEAKATRIQVFNSSLIPGLLQTEEYARALFRVSLIGESEDQVNGHVEARMRRKRVFNAEKPPLFWAIIDEAALKRPIGDMKCMRGQIMHLVKGIESRQVTLQVLPFSQGEHPILGGSLSLLTLRSGATIGYVESFATGEVAESPRKVLELTQMFDVARAKALPQKESLTLIKTYLLENENETDS